MAISFKGARFPKEVILMGVRWYVAYPLSTRHVEELMEERGVEVEHATINRWVIKYSPQLEGSVIEVMLGLQFHGMVGQHQRIHIWEVSRNR
jgi:transposase-like protein